MKAARFHAANDIRVEDVPKPPEPGDDEVTIDVHWCGICGTDLHEYIKGPLVINPPSRPHSLTGCCLPVTMGHELCGRIAKVPNNYQGGLKVGDAVMVDPRLNCQSCENCVSGLDHLCSIWGFLGLNAAGGLAERVNVASRMVHVLPESVKMDDAALIEPLTVGKHAVSVAGIVDEQWKELSVLVLGGGPIGVAVLYNLKAKGVGKAFVSEPTARRTAMVRELGLVSSGEDVLNPLIVSVPDECRKRTNGKGVDVVFDCAGIMAGLTAGMDALKARGRYINVAGWETPLIMPLHFAMLKEITFRPSMGYDQEDFKEVVDNFAAGKYAGAERMITARVSLDDVAAKAFEELITKKDEHVKILVTPRKELVA